MVVKAVVSEQAWSLLAFATVGGALARGRGVTLHPKPGERKRPTGVPHRGALASLVKR